MEQQGEGDLQAGGQQGGVPPLGTAQEQAGHELRDHGSRSQVYSSLLSGFPTLRVKDRIQFQRRYVQCTVFFIV